MSQEQPRRPQDDQEPIKHGNVLSDAEGELAQKPVVAKDSAMVQQAETASKGGVAAAMRNESAGSVSHDDASNISDEQDISVTVTDVPGRRISTEAVGGQAVRQFSQRVPLVPPSTIQQGSSGGITIGEALEATAVTAGQKPVEWSDAAAIQAAEVRATGRTNIVPGGVAAAAQSAATLNARATRGEDKTKLSEVLVGATSRLPSDKPATRRDAEGVTSAEMRNDPYLTTHPTGVAASVAAAARLNQNINNNSQQPTS
ncbi:hypothetical protein FNV43_RR04809 [Rhamnella rubrinervis]|uniref:SMP domain-containing protein n=1 Tax=Rhamnella rubrinervis TaxID=2594499 RepID=A0A8K0HKH5_9ROSA|nr:hypothetical protein FNV43_RR04809 [Rhamnella rubrinervis]